MEKDTKKMSIYFLPPFYLYKNEGQMTLLMTHIEWQPPHSRNEAEMHIEMEKQKYDEKNT